MKDALFIFFSLFCIGCGLGVVFARNAIYSSFSLVLCFFGLAAIYVLWGANFIAVVQVLIYTGAIVVLFLFVVMLLDLVRGSPTSGAGWGMVIVCGICVWFFSLLLLRTLNQATIFTPLAAGSMVDLRSLSRLLFTDYLWPFEVLSFFLLALIVGVFALARPEEGKGGES
jgi:NADH-quinone oxidoreductase subunit J